MFAVVAWAGAALVLVVGVTTLAGTAGPRSTTTVRQTVPAGEPLLMPSGTSARQVWGSPAAVDLAAVTCTGTSPLGEQPVDVATERTVATDTASGDEVVLVATVPTLPRVDEVVCSGGGLTSAGVATAGSPGRDRTFGAVLLLLSPVLVVIGLVARHASRRRPR